MLNPTAWNIILKRHLVLKTIILCSSLTPQLAVGISLAQSSESSKSFLSGLANTKSWFQFYGDGFAIRVPPDFENMTEPEDYNVGLSYYGDKAKPKTFAARFASSDGLEAVSVIIRPSNQLKITFFEAKDISDLGTLRMQQNYLFQIRFHRLTTNVRVQEQNIILFSDNVRWGNYLFCGNHKSDGRGKIPDLLVEMTNISHWWPQLAGGKAFVGGATAPASKWDKDGVKLRSAAISLAIL